MVRVCGQRKGLAVLLVYFKTQSISGTNALRTAVVTREPVSRGHAVLALAALYALVGARPQRCRAWGGVPIHGGRQRARVHT